MNENILRDWDHADQYLKDKFDKADNSFDDINTEIEHIKGTADGQFIYDTEVKMTKVVPDGVNKGIVSMIGGKTQKCKNFLSVNEATVSADSGGYVLRNLAISIPAGNYVLSYNQTATTEELSIALRTNSDSTLYDVTLKNTKTVNVPITISERATKISIYTNVPSVVTDMMLRKETDSDVYEPYHKELWNTSVDKVVLRGANIWDEKWEQGLYSATTGEPQATTNNIRCKNYIEIKPNTTYSMNTHGRFHFYDASKNFVGTVVGSDGIKVIATSMPTAKYMRFNLAIEYGNTYKNNVIIAESTAPLAYVPYNADYKTTLSLERIVDKLPDYGCSAGDVYNYIDFENMVYHHRVRELDMSTITGWARFAAGIEDIYTAIIKDAVYTNSQKGTKNVICTKYSTFSDAYGDKGVNLPDKSVSVGSWARAKSSLVIKDSSVADSALIPQAVAGERLVYELESEELIDISDLLLPFKCEPGGTVTFENEHNLDVPNTVIYEKEMK